MKFIPIPLQVVLVSAPAEKQVTPEEMQTRALKCVFDIADAGVRQAWALALLSNPFLLSFTAMLAPPMSTKPELAWSEE